jgi:hypothetical protein
MGKSGFALIAVLVLAVAAPQQIEAQGPLGQRQTQRDRDMDRDRRDRDGRDVWDVVLGRRGDSRAGGPGGGPPFCQNGQGHPVFGRDWGYQQGFGVGRGGDLGDIIFRSPGRDRRLNQGGLIDVLGDVVFGRVQERSRTLGARDPLYGRWHAAPGGGQALSIRSGDLIIAELVDQTLDGRVDLFRLRRER